MTLNLFARLGFALLMAVPVFAHAETDELPPLPERNAMRPPAAERNPGQAQAPVVEKPVLPGDAATVPWTEGEVAKAKADCTKILVGLALEYEALPPIKEGMCGAPAPILVKSIGGDPKVVIDPPATVTCALASALSVWLGKTVQSEARGLVGAPVVKLHNATSYACRNRYGSAEAPLSEHALANALDISEFVFQSGERVTVLLSWPRVVTVPPLPLPNPTRVAAEITGSTPPVTHARPRTVSAIDVANTTVTDARTNPFVLPTAAARAAPPVPPAEATEPDAQTVSERNRDFVMKLHADACNIFGTVLGPEANDAHEDHFHLDMKARRRSAFCE
ncbi:MAG: extensin family protein [Methyloceanibacter sp.]|nr:extensin family protein [Methyloceanibacter sp.]